MTDDLSFAPSATLPVKDAKLSGVRKCNHEFSSLVVSIRHADGRRASVGCTNVSVCTNNIQWADNRISHRDES